MESDIDELFNQINPEDHPPIPAQQDVHQILNDNASANMVSCFTYVVKRNVVYLCDITVKCHDHLIS